MYDISELEIFLAISKTLNLSKAADHLNMAQSTVSKKLKNLENELHTTLVKRSKGTKTLFLTEMIALWSKAHELDSQAFRPTLTAASLSSLNQTIFPAMFLKIHHEHPEVKLNILTVHSADIYGLIENHQADIGFTLLEKVSPLVTVKKWLSEPMAAAQPLQYPPRFRFPFAAFPERSQPLVPTATIRGKVLTDAGRL